ncbi:tail fiber protein [Acidovorax sp. NCPPB 3576]|nr:tail fiber protein [Acidovorax sp. NCPPB 3576]WCM87069.1 tail fiber protein [Acidovorax sp. NCPPB 3576]
MSQPFMGQIALFAGSFAPRGWAFCNGQIMSIAQNAALFSILGTTYGGDGQATFALPDLRGRVPIGYGSNTGATSPRSWGETGGTEQVTLNVTQLPAHNHSVNVHSPDVGNQPSPSGNYLATPDRRGNNFSDQAPASTLGPAAIGSQGGNQPHPNMQPYLAISYIIALQGIFPQRN